MPPKSQRIWQLIKCLKKGREVLKRKRAKMAAINSEYVEDIVDLVKISDNALDTEDEAVDHSFELNSSIMSDSDYLVAIFVA